MWFCLLLQTEIAKRLNAILAQIMPFLSQEVSLNPVYWSSEYWEFVSIS